MTYDEVHVIASDVNLSYQKVQVVVFGDENAWCDRLDRPAVVRHARGRLGRTWNIGSEGEVVAVLVVDGCVHEHPLRVLADATPDAVTAAIAEVMET